MNQTEQLSNWLNYLIIAFYIHLLVPSRFSGKRAAAVLTAGSLATFLFSLFWFLSAR